MDCPAHLLELPFHLATMTWGAIIMGLTGHDIRLFHKIRENLAGSAAADAFYVEDNGILKVDLAGLIIGAVTFVWGIICIALTIKQFKGRKGNYTGEGTAHYVPVLIVYLTLLGAWTGMTSAYTAYANTRTWSITPGPKYQEPLSEGLRYVLYQINQSFYSSYVNPITVPENFQSLGVPSELLAPFNTVTTAQEVNDLGSAAARPYLRAQVYKATVINFWFALAVVFTAFVVHTLLPIVLKFLGWTRTDKRKKEEALALESREYDE